MGEIRHGGESVPLKRNIAQRIKSFGFTYPYGSYPEDEFFQQIGYDAKYLTDEQCFYYKIVLPHERLQQMLSASFKLLPPTARLAAKVHSGDFYRDFDTHISDDLVDRDEVIEWAKEWGEVVLDDGFFGIGMFAEEETVEVFIDEHKTIHIYHSDPDLMELFLENQGIPFVMDLAFFWDEPHFHEPLPLDEKSDDEDYLTAFEDLADRYELFLDLDDDTNTDDEGQPLGVNCWRVELRGYKPESSGDHQSAKGFYTTLYLNAETRRDVIDLVSEYFGERNEQVDIYLQIARVPTELLTSDMHYRNSTPEESCVWHESGRAFFEWGHERS